MALLQREALPGAILLGTGLIALIISNSPISYLYFQVVNSTQPINTLFIVNELLMTIFFLDVGFEIKHQVVIGHLSKPRQVLLPVLSAIGGVVMPALIFIALNKDNHVALKGWAIPTATDIAFALGVIILLGKRIPIGLRILLLTIAIVDDIIAMLIIALFYTTNIAFIPLTCSFLLVCVLFYLNFRNVTNIIHYLMIGTILWYCMLLSGLHPTLSGVLVALATPIKAKEDFHARLYIWVSYVILPLFAFLNAGISLAGIHLQQMFQSIPLGVALGLLIGKPVGVFSFSYLGVKSGLAVLPKKVSWIHMYGMSVVCGVGFTMSIFIGNLAYIHTSSEYMILNKLGVLAGSIASAIIGYVFLRIFAEE